MESVHIPIKQPKNVKRAVLRTTFHKPEVFNNLIQKNGESREHYSSRNSMCLNNYLKKVIIHLLNANSLKHIKCMLVSCYVSY